MLLEINHLEKVFRTRFSKEETRALQDVDFKVDKNEFIAIMGESGSGKTTLLNILATLEKPTKGSVMLNGEDITKIKESQLAAFRLKNLGFVFQDFNLLDTLSVKDNIFLSLVLGRLPYQEMEQRLQPLAKKLHIESLLDKRPFELSGGQKQRVGIARALANEPTVLLCDEATSALDPQTTDEILDLLLKIKEQRNLTIVIITHEMHVIRRICDEVAVMENGSVIEQGSVTNVFENPKHEVTKRFVKEDLNDDFEDAFADIEHFGKDDYIVRLNFTGNNTTEPIVSYITRAHQIDVNILEANIKNTKSGSIGFLVLHLPNINSEKFEDFNSDLAKQQVSVEVLRHD